MDVILGGMMIILIQIVYNVLLHIRYLVVILLQILLNAKQEFRGLWTLLIVDVMMAGSMMGLMLTVYNVNILAKIVLGLVLVLLAKILYNIILIVLAKMDIMLVVQLA